jgi:Mrp family chromosome partitioning ATPase
MILADADHGVASQTSVLFLPASSPAKAAGLNINRFVQMALVERIVSEVGSALVDLGTQTKSFGPGDAGTVVLVTGCRGRVGCSTVALALATAMAGSESVLVLDGDLERLGLSNGLEIAAVAGWEDVVRGIESPEEPLLSIGPPPGLAFLPLRRPVADPDELLATSSLLEWQAGLRRDYDVVIVDGGSVWDSGVRWAPWVDVAVVVADCGQKLADDWARAWDRLEESGTSVMGIVETMG